MFIGLVFVSILLVTPVSLFSVVDPITKSISTSNSTWSNFSAAINNLASPLSLALCNAVIIPLLVDLTAMLSYRETKSAEQRTIFQLNLFFMTMNMIFLPLTGLVSIKDFLSTIADKSFLDQISKNMGQMAAFFATYLMQTTFIFNCI
jgi:hypothetical protein